MISDLRDQLVADLEEAGLSVHVDLWAERAEPPAVLVRHPLGGTYVAAGQRPGHFEVNLDLLLVVPLSETSTVDLDSLIEQVLLNTVDWAFRGVDTIGLFNIDGVDYPGTAIHIAKQQRLY